MVCFVPGICLSIRKSFQRRDCSELGTVRNWVDHCIYVFFPFCLFFFLNMCHYHHYYFISLLFSVAKEVDVKMDFVK